MLQALEFKEMVQVKDMSLNNFVQNAEVNEGVI